MNSDEPDETGLEFLIQLFEHVKGDPSVQASMYEIGELMGLDRDTASRVAEDLIGQQLIEIRTLSGGIGISADGAGKAQSLVGAAGAGDQKIAKLDDSLVLDGNAADCVNAFIDELKSRAGALGLGFEDLTDLMADLKTIDAQMASSHPKTAIIRECFGSIQAALEKADDKEIMVKVKAFLGA